MKLELNKQYGPALVNLLRQASMLSVPVIKPIAFAVGPDSNVVDTCSSVIEDMTVFIHNVMSKTYYTDNPDDKIDMPILVALTVQENLKTSDFAQFGINCKDDAIVLHALSSVNVKMYFRNSCGKYTTKQNIEFLQNAGVNTNDLVVVPSRHCAVNSFILNPTENEDKFICDIAIESDIMSEKTILRHALKTVEDGVAKLSNFILNS